MIVATLLLLVIGACALLTLHPKTPKDPLEKVYLEFCTRLGQAGLMKHPHETGQKYVRRVERLLDTESAGIAKTFIKHYYAWRYGEKRPSKEDMRHLEQLLNGFKP